MVAVTHVPNEARNFFLRPPLFPLRAFSQFHSGIKIPLTPPGTTPLTALLPPLLLSLLFVLMLTFRRLLLRTFV